MSWFWQLFANYLQLANYSTFYTSNFRPFLIDKSWIASGFRPRNDMKHFRPNVLLKCTTFDTISLQLERIGKILSSLISGRRDSNSRQSAWKADTLPTELRPQLQIHLIINIFFLQEEVLGSVYAIIAMRFIK